MSKSKTNWASIFSIVASVATIISLFLALLIFNTQICIQEKNQIDEYKNVLITVEREAEQNKAANQAILSGEVTYTDINNVMSPRARYYTETIDNVLSMGIVRNKTIIGTMFDVAWREHGANSALNNANSLFHSSVFFEHGIETALRIVDDNKAALHLSDELKNMLPELRKLINEEIDNVKPKTLFCH